MRFGSLLLLMDILQLAQSIILVVTALCAFFAVIGVLWLIYTVNKNKVLNDSDNASEMQQVKQTCLDII